MKKVLTAFLVMSAALLAACGTTATVQTQYRLSPDEKLRLQLVAPTATPEGTSILRDRLNAQLSSSNLLAPAAATPSVRTIEVTVTN